MFDVIKLALETDSSRIISLFIDTTVIHNITHHGNRPEVLAELRGHEEGQGAALSPIRAAAFLLAALLMVPPLAAQTGGGGLSVGGDGAWAPWPSPTGSAPWA